MQAYGFHQGLYMPPPPAPSHRRDLVGRFSTPPIAYCGGGGGTGLHRVPVVTNPTTVNKHTMGVPRNELVADFSAMSMNGESKSRNSTSSTFRWRLDAPEFIPQSMRYVPAAQPTPDFSGTYGNDRAALTTQQQQNDQLQCFLWELVNWLTHLYMDPGNFDIIARQISSQMNYTVRCERDLQAVIDKFFEISMSYPHFSYHAARLCVNFNGRFSACPEDSALFRKVLLKRCAQMMDTRCLMLDEPTLVSQLHNFLMFMAELCVQFMDRGRPMEFVVGSIVQLITDLLLRPTDLNVRACISALKCCGPFLQHYAADELQKVLDLLHSDSVMKALPPNLILAIESLAELRGEWQKSSLEMLTMAEADNWAKNIAESAANSVLDQSDALPPAPVYYGPDGVPLTNEETAFLAEMDQQGSCDEDLSAPNDVLSEDDMIAEAYEQFLEMQKDAKQN